MICRRLVQNAATGTYTLRVTIAGTAAVTGRLDVNGKVKKNWVQSDLVPGPVKFLIASGDRVIVRVDAKFGKASDTATVDLLKGEEVLRTCPLAGTTNTSIITIVT